MNANNLFLVLTTHMGIFFSQIRAKKRHGHATHGDQKLGPGAKHVGLVQNLTETAIQCPFFTFFGPDASFASLCCVKCTTVHGRFRMDDNNKTEAPIVTVVDQQMAEFSMSRSDNNHNNAFAL
jgi:hypothetical protein